MRHPLVPAGAALLLAAGCAGAGAHPVSPARAPDPCASPAAAAPRDTVAVGFDRTVRPDPVIARQLVASAGAADCAGQPRDSGAYDLLRRHDTLYGVPRRRGLPVLRFGSRPAADARDLLDAGTDLVVTRDDRAIAYARSRPDLIPVPLAWDRIYMLASPTVLPAAKVLEAVRGEARVPAGPFWWTGNPVCTADGFNGTNQRRTRLVIPAGDPVARDLAARIAAGTPGVTVAPADSAEFARALDRGMDAGYLIGLPRLAPAACPITPWLASWQVTPLVETRPYAILRQGAVRISTDADGLFRIVEAGP